MRFAVEYFDHNESFAKLLPQSGVVERTVTSNDGNKWFLFSLDHAIEYEGKTYSHFLLRSRWKGYEIDDGKGTSIFILLVDQPTKVQEGVDIHHFTHVAWGMVNA